ncbi:trypsin-like peptidase domain-containing protein [Uliginosibacterium sp. H3]|uniref:Trypsin-like peptidase domain-containing protein n=1 Tax=Uliginosibacterium silvisoli TaxID=3114758 RepID=A0ABU6JZU2_9RHOO|nr:trypsin-like peptidase domain-containing protein [Uliginosibacterium sp. H3]
MKRVTLYSSSGRSRATAGSAQATGSRGGAHAPASPTAPSPEPPESRAAAANPADPSLVPSPSPRKTRRLSALYHRHPTISLLTLSAVIALCVVLAHAHWTPAPQLLTQGDIDTAVRRSLEKKPLPSNAARAYEKVRPSVVRVRGYARGKNPKTGEVGEFERGVGTGVVVVDKGLILTNLHVVSGNERINLVFADGTESDAIVVGLQPQHDLAVLQAKTVPDDLVAATLRSTADLKPGDDVVAVGFPFGFGPSASAGVISGLKREFRTPKGERPLSNLIQFDAAANPGNSGGPLVNLRGEVVGIVTAILNPHNEGFFVGLGFAVPIEEAAGAVGVSPF